jgi:hypothetical protein
LQKIVIVPTGFETFALDSEFGEGVLFEKIEGDAVEQGEVLRSVLLPFAVEVFAEADIERPSAACSRCPSAGGPLGSAVLHRASNW